MSGFSGWAARFCGARCLSELEERPGKPLSRKRERVDRAPRRETGEGFQALTLTPQPCGLGPSLSRKRERGFKRSLRWLRLHR
jgi:hypothetical protein